MKAREITKKITDAGGEKTRQVGSHARYRLTRDGITCYTTVPMHTGDIPAGTLSSIDRDLAPILGKGWTKK